MSRPDPWGAPTHWSLVKRAADTDDPQANEQAWNELVARYREAVQSSVSARCRGRGDAEEIADDFFTYVFEQDVLAKAEPERGKFRQFMNGVLRRYVAQRTRTGDRAGSFEQTVASPTDVTLSGRKEEFEWANELLRRAIERLIDPEAHPRNGILLLRTYGIEPYDSTPRAELREEHGLTQGAFDEALAAARRRLRQHIKEEVQSSNILARPEDREALATRLLEAFPGLRVTR